MSEFSPSGTPGSGTPQTGPPEPESPRYTRLRKPAQARKPGQFAPDYGNLVAEPAEPANPTITEPKESKTMPTVVNISDQPAAPATTTTATADDPVAAANIAAKETKTTAKTATATARQAAKEAKENIPILPTPPVPKLGGQVWASVTAKDGPDKAIKVWEYWHDTDQKYPGRLQVYVYRLYPICVKLSKEEKDELTEGIGDKIYGFPDYEYNPTLENLSTYILTRWGSGNYRFIFKDTALGHVLFALLLNGIWDWNYPPNISLDRIDKDHPNNKTFLEELNRRTGRGNSSNSYSSKGEMAMADSNAQQQLNVVGPLVNTVRELATGKRDQVDTGAIVEGVNKSWSNTFDTILTMVKSNQQQQAAAADPATHVKQIIDIAKTMAPAQPDMTGIVAQLTAVQTAAQARVDKLIDLQLRQSEERQRHMEEELRELRRERANPGGNGGGQANDPLAVLDRVLAIKDKLSELGGGGGDDDGGGGRPERRPWYADLLQVATPIIGQMAQAFMIYMQGQGTGMGMGNATRPGPALAPMGMPQQLPQMGNPQPAAASQPVQAPQPQQQQQSQSQPSLQSQPEDTAMHPYTMFFNQLAGPLLNHLNSPDQDGIDFAIWFIHGHGRTQYAQVAGLGKDTLLAAMAQYAPQLWAAVSVPSRDVPGVQVPTQEFAQFIEEFLDTAAVQQALSGGGDDTGSSGDTDTDGDGDVDVETPEVEVIQGKPNGDVTTVKPRRKGSPVDIDVAPVQ